MRTPFKSIKDDSKATKGKIQPSRSGGKSFSRRYERRKIREQLRHLIGPWPAWIESGPLRGRSEPSLGQADVPDVETDDLVGWKMAPRKLDILALRTAV